MTEFQKLVYPVVKVAKLKNKRQSRRGNFYCRVYNIVRRIKHGRTMTYVEVARAVGRPKAYRAVGNALNKNYDPSVPCHRVVRSDGKIGRYNRGNKLKEKLLQEEGVIIYE